MKRLIFSRGCAKGLPVQGRVRRQREFDQLRTPLNPMTRFSEMMATSPESYRGAALPGEYRGDVVAIYRSARHLSGPINDSGTCQRSRPGACRSVASRPICGDRPGGGRDRRRPRRFDGCCSRSNCRRSDSDVSRPHEDSPGTPQSPHERGAIHRHRADPYVGQDRRGRGRRSRSRTPGAASMRSAWPRH